jgi:hypothetical protein
MGDWLIVFKARQSGAPLHPERACLFFLPANSRPCLPSCFFEQVHKTPASVSVGCGDMKTWA